MCKDFCKPHIDDWDSGRNICNTSAVCEYINVDILYQPSLYITSMKQVNKQVPDSSDTEGNEGSLEIQHIRSLFYPDIRNKETIRKSP